MEKLHPKAVWLFFINAVISFFLFGLFFFPMFLGIFFQNFFQKGPIHAFLIPGLALLLIGPFVLVLVSWIWAKLAYQYWNYELTENSLKIEKGVIWKKYISIPYDRIQNIDIHRGVFARILKLSDLQVQTAGYSHSQPGIASEGRLPGLDPLIAEELRETSN